MLSSPETVTERGEGQEKREDLRGVSYGSREELEIVYKHYFGNSPVIQQDLFSGRFKDMAIAGNMYEQVIGREV